MKGGELILQPRPSIDPNDPLVRELLHPLRISRTILKRNPELARVEEILELRTCMFLCRNCCRCVSNAIPASCKEKLTRNSIGVVTATWGSMNRQLGFSFDSKLQPNANHSQAHSFLFLDLRIENSTSASSEIFQLSNLLNLR